MTIEKTNLTVYILKCSDDKYYVGKTYNFKKRYNEHLAGKGSLWTSLYKPIKILEIINDADIYDEDKYVWKYMEKYGIENVRGGSYSQIFLTEESINCAKKHIQSSLNLCYSCGQPGHLISKCSANQNNNTNNNTNTSQNDNQNGGNGVPRKRKLENDQEIESTNEKNKKQKVTYVSKCTRCGRYGHHLTQCYAKIHRDGTYLGQNF